MSEELRALNEEGRRQYREWLEKLRDSPALPVPSALLNDPACSFAPVLGLRVPQGPFKTKLELAAALLPLIEQVEGTRLPEERWPGVWDGLALAYFDEICPANAGGNRNAKGLERYMFTDDYRKVYRHRIYGPAVFLRSSPSSAALFLSGTPDTLSDQEEQIGSRLELVVNPAMLETLFTLYWDTGRIRPKRGWAPNSPKAGTLRRFIAVMAQLSRTYDLFGCSSEGILRLLPQEFDQWRPTTQ